MGQKASTAVDCPASLIESECCSVDIRKIDNGYIIRESRSTAQGYTSSERFSKTNPGIGEKARDTNPGTESMRNAMKELRRK